MRVFILCTGRSGSMTLIRACKHIQNYTAGHETRSTTFGKERFAFPENHIEGDNRLSWVLGNLEKEHGDDAFYVHLKRNRDKVASSFMLRFYQPSSMIDAFCEGIKKSIPERLDSEERLAACYDYVDTVNSNIEYFLRNKSKKLEMNLENIKLDFKELWKMIEAEGNLEEALAEFDIRHNSSRKRNLAILRRMRIFIIREWRHWKLSFKS